MGRNETEQNQRVKIRKYQSVSVIKAKINLLLCCVNKNLENSYKLRQMSFIGVSNDFILTFGTLDTILVITFNVWK